MNKILFVCHGSRLERRELAALVGQIMVFGTVGYYGFTTSEGTKKEPVIQALFSWFCSCFFLLRTSVAVP